MDEVTMHILIAGGSGLIGKAITRKFLENGHQVSILTRDISLVRSGNPQYVAWDGKYQCGWSETINRVDGIINLAGESIGSGRWTGARKKVS
jgi:NAD dependent epimerase/dehydratase family enzyme